MIGAIAIGLLGGVVAGMLGVGGGVLFVPGLVIFLGLGQHEAEATSLAAIVFIAAFGAATQGLYGNVRLLDAVLVGVPAVGGVLFGTWLQQRVRGRSISLMFAALLFASAAELVLR